MRNPQSNKGRQRSCMPYLTGEMSQILARVEKETDDSTLVQSIHFSPTAMTFIRRLISGKGTVIADTSIAYSGVDTKAIEALGLKLECFIDDPSVINAAEKKHVTRAEISVDQGLALPGMKLFVIGSAPMALKKLLTRNQLLPMHDVAIIATPTGYASVVQLKERAWESNLPIIVTRGHKGGAVAASTILNALLAESCSGAK